jgi:hypothetical protein
MLATLIDISAKEIKILIKSYLEVKKGLAIQHKKIVSKVETELNRGVISKLNG